MGLMIDGVWTREDRLGSVHSGTQGPTPALRNWVTADGRAGPSGRGGFHAEPGRYHLYVSYACPWAHRTLIYRSLKGLTEMIDVSIVHWFMGEDGWNFGADEDGIVGDRLFGSAHLHDVYRRSERTYSGRVTVPVLWDKQTERIVSNESSEIIRMFDSAFDHVGARPGTFYPLALRADIDALNTRIFETLNRGVYRAGFATSQADYEAAVRPLFQTLDWLEDRLAAQRFLLGDAPLEADWRLLPTLLRFDIAYHGHFKCNLKRLIDYPNLWAYTRDLYQWPGIAGTCRFDHAKRHYYASHRHINPTGIVPVGPEIDFAEAHGREALT